MELNINEIYNNNLNAHRITSMAYKNRGSLVLHTPQIQPKKKVTYNDILTSLNMKVVDGKLQIVRNTFVENIKSNLHDESVSYQPIFQQQQQLQQQQLQQEQLQQEELQQEELQQEELQQEELQQSQIHQQPQQNQQQILEQYKQIQRINYIKLLQRQQHINNIKSKKLKF